MGDSHQSMRDKDQVQFGRCYHKVALAGQETRAGFPRSRLDLQEITRPPLPGPLHLGVIHGLCLQLATGLRVPSAGMSREG